MSRHFRAQSKSLSRPGQRDRSRSPPRDPRDLRDPRDYYDPRDSHPRGPYRDPRDLDGEIVSPGARAYGYGYDHLPGPNRYGQAAMARNVNILLEEELTPEQKAEIRAGLEKTADAQIKNQPWNSFVGAHLAKKAVKPMVTEVAEKVAEKVVEERAVVLKQEISVENQNRLDQFLKSDTFGGAVKSIFDKDLMPVLRDATGQMITTKLDNYHSDYVVPNLKQMVDNTTQVKREQETQAKRLSILEDIVFGSGGAGGAGAAGAAGAAGGAGGAGAAGGAGGAGAAGAPHATPGARTAAANYGIAQEKAHHLMDASGKRVLSGSALAAKAADMLANPHLYN